MISAKTTRGVESMKSPKELAPQLGPDPIAQRLQKLGLPLTVENYLSFDWPDGPPNPLPAEIRNQAEKALRSVQNRPRKKTAA